MGKIIEDKEENKKEIKRLKKLYNILIKLHKKGEDFFEDKKKSLEEKEKKIPRMKDILDSISDVINAYECRTGKKMTEDEIKNGFKDI